MKWFQVDASTPADPKIQCVLARFGNAGLGMLLRLWCFVAAHGKRKPGWSLDTSGKPIPRASLVAATGASEPEFKQLIAELTRNGHVVESMWKKRGVIVIPAMSRRADTYAMRRVRTLFEHSSNKLHVQDSTVQYKVRTRAGARNGSLRSPVSSAPDKTKTTKTGSHCGHTPRCATFKACVQRTISEARHAQKR